MDASSIIEEIKSMANESAKKMWLKHGSKEPFYAVKIEDLKKIQKRVKKDYKLSLELYDSGITDAMYLAGLIADEKKMTEKDLRTWAEKAPWSMISDYTVPWVAAESDHGWKLGLEWIESDSECIGSSGWATLASLVAIKKDKELDIPKLKALLKRVENTINKAANRVRYNMNNFVISVGCYVTALTDEASATGKKIGTVEVDMGGTSCKVPSAPEYINKVIQRGSLGKKKKQARC